MLGANETSLVGKWAMKDGRIVADDICERISALTASYLTKVADGNWTVLYQDPLDKRYWELSYPLGELQGGGPPALTNIHETEVRDRYVFLSNSQCDSDGCAASQLSR